MPSIICDYEQEWLNVDQPYNDYECVLKKTKHRHKCISKWGFAIPNEEVIYKLSECPQPIIEHGAGLAWWAHLVNERYGVKIDCFDKVSYPTDTQNNKIIYPFHRESWYPVTVGLTQDYIDKKDYQTLVLIWPCYNSNDANEVLQLFKGSTVFYVGEGEGGCTANDAFHEYLKEKFEQVEIIQNPHWSGIYDRTFIYKRK